MYLSKSHPLITLQFYQDSWLKLVDAIASLIDEDSDFVFDALDGKTDEPVMNGGKQHQQDINYREEPAAFFFVLFGLAFEALASRPTSSGGMASNRKLEILKALKKILQPSVAGNAIYQEVVFSETMDLLDRMVLTEGIDVQTVIVEIARNLCLVHPSSRAGQDTSQDAENLSDDIDQLFELTRIIVLVLAGLIPGLAESNRPTRAEISDEAVVLIRLSLGALVDVAEVFPSIIKGDLHACIFHLFTTILGTGSCQAAVVPQALPLFRRFVNSIIPDADSESRRQISNTLGRFLIILKNAQKRENEAALACEKNTILACTILITTANGVLAADDKGISTLIGALSEALTNPMTTKMAAGCARSLLLIPGKKSPTKATISAQLFPRLIALLTSPSSSEADLEGLAETKDIITQALVTFATNSDNRTAAYAIVIPALLASATKQGESSHKETAARLMELAAADQNAFRALVLRLGTEQRAFMERVLRDGQGSARRTDSVGAQDQGQPSIALKLDF